MLLAEILQPRMPVSSLLTFESFENGLFFLKDGVVGAIYRFKGVGVGSKNDAFFNELPLLLQKIFKSFDLSCNVTIQKLDYFFPRKVDVFGNKILDDHFTGRVKSEHSSYFVITSSEKPPPNNPLATHFLASSLGRMFKNPRGKKGFNKRLSLFNEGLVNFENIFLTDDDLSVSRITDNISFCNLTNQHFSFGAPVGISKPDLSLKDDITVDDGVIRIGSNYATVVPVVKMGEAIATVSNTSVSSGYFHSIFNGLNFPHLVCTLFRLNNNEKELDRIATSINVSNASLTNQYGAVDQEAQLRAETLTRASRDIRAGGLLICQVGQICVAMASDRQKAIERGNLINARYTALGIQSTLERVDCLNVFASTLPCFGYDFYRMLKTTHPVASCFLNLEGNNRYDEQGEVFLDETLSPVRFSLFSDRTDNKHILLIGPSGSGKSFWTNYLIWGRHLRNWRQIIIDVGGSFANIVASLGGKHIDYNPKNPVKLNPFIITKVNGKYDLDEEAVSFLVSFISIIFSEQDDSKITKIEYAIVTSMLTGYYELVSEKEEVPMIGDFYTYCYGYLNRDAQNDTEKEQLAQFNKAAFLAALQLYSTEGIYGKVFNFKEADDFADERLISFDIDSIKEAEYYPLVFATINNLTAQVVKRYPSDKMGIYMDECWVLLGKQPEFIEYYVRTGRKNLISLCIITQTVLELVNSPIGTTLSSNIDTKILLEHKGKDDVLKVSKEFFSLTDFEYKKARNLTRGKNPTFRQFFVKQKELSFVLGIEVPPILHPYFISEKDWKKIFEYLLARFGNYASEYSKEYFLANPLEDGETITFDKLCKLFIKITDELTDTSGKGLEDFKKLNKDKFQLLTELSKITTT